MFEYKVTKTDGKARTGVLTTPHGEIQTPVFMPVGTHGAVKGVSPSELTQVGSQIILANTYHMYLRPGEEVVAELGDLHGFMNWKGPILTDSGGFQVFSLGERGISGSEKQAMRSVSEEGITFKSHLDGSKHLFTPEKSIQVQQKLGADIIMAFDQPVYGMSTPEAAGEAMRRSMRWLERSRDEWAKGDTQKQALFGIVQGGIHENLHRESAEFVASLDLPGNAIGGLSVGEDKPTMWQATESICNLLPEEKPRYFMGLGDPYDLVEAVRQGIDMFDCVAPSRLARHGSVWVPSSEAFWAGDTEFLIKSELRFDRINLLNSKFAKDASRITSGNILPEDIAALKKGTIHHYIKEHEMLGFRALTLYNIAVLHRVVSHVHNAIQMNRLDQFMHSLK
jgi:queuine tRNA-ribosyltransferase